MTEFVIFSLFIFGKRKTQICKHCEFSSICFPPHCVNIDKAVNNCYRDFAFLCGNVILKKEEKIKSCTAWVLF